MGSSSNIDPEDWEIFQSSLLVLHSTDIGSDFKMYKLLQKSIRKHHPTIKNWNKNLALKSTEYRAFTDPERVPNEHQHSASKKDKISTNLCKNVTKSEMKTPIGAGGKLSIDKVNNCLAPGLTQSSRESQQINTATCLPTKSKEKGFTMICVEPSTNTPKKRISLLTNRETSNNSKQLTKSYLKNMSRHNHSQSPVNLKKIRAVLARGDPFPTHLTKLCINNITPDLQREKL